MLSPPAYICFFALQSLVPLLTRFLLLLIPFLPFPLPSSSPFSHRVLLTTLLHISVFPCLAFGNISLSRPSLAGPTDRVSPSSCLHHLLRVCKSHHPSGAAQLLLSLNPSLSRRWLHPCCHSKLQRRWAVPPVVDSPKTSLLVPSLAGLTDKSLH